MDQPAIFIHHYSLTAPAAILDQVIDFYGKLLDLKPGYRPDFFDPTSYSICI